MISSIEVTRKWMLEQQYDPIHSLLSGYEGPTGILTIGLDDSSMESFVRGSTRVIIEGPDPAVSHMTTVLVTQVYGII